MLKNKSRLFVFAIALVAIFLWASALLPGHKTLNVTFLDVGEGLCVVVQTPSGKIVAMDCGTSGRRDNTSIGQNLTARYLQQLGADSIDVAILSHPHADHISGYATLLDAKPAKMVLDIGVHDRTPYYKAFLRSVRKCRAHYRIAKRGQSIDMGDGVILQILSPSPDVTYSNLNERSMVTRIVFKHTSILLTGDADREAEEDLLKSGNSLCAQVLQVGHHGSETSTSTQWLASVRPQVAIISCGRRNRYRHPSPSTLMRLNSSGCKVYRTDRNGAVVVTTDGSTISIRSFRQNTR